MKTKDVVQDGLTAAGGYVVGQLVSSMALVKSNPMLSVAVPAIGAVIVANAGGKQIKGAATGLFVAAVVNGIRTFAPNLATTAGLGAVPMASAYIPGVSGYDDYVPPVIVE